MKKILLFICTLFILSFTATHSYGQNSFNDNANMSDTAKTSFYELQKLKLYPNPATDYLHIEYDIVYIKDAKIKIYNSIGSVVYTKVLENKQEHLKISVSDFDNGLYFCSLQIDGKSFNTKKILINHR